MSEPNFLTGSIFSNSKLHPILSKGKHARAMNWSRCNWLLHWWVCAIYSFSQHSHFEDSWAKANPIVYITASHIRMSHCDVPFPSLSLQSRADLYRYGSHRICSRYFHLQKSVETITLYAPFRDSKHSKTRNILIVESGHWSINLTLSALYSPGFRQVYVWKSQKLTLGLPACKHLHNDWSVVLLEKIMQVIFSLKLQ